MKKLLFVLVLVLVVFVVTARDASAEDFYFFRIDTEINVPAYYGTSGATVTWRCNGTGYGIVTDGTASESTNLLDGIIKVASTSAENNASHAGCDGGESITATASFSGWVSRLWSDTVSAVGPNVTFTTLASMDYTILVNGVTDENSAALTLNGTTASAAYSLAVASQSYSGGKKYIAATASGGTVSAEGGTSNGYVKRTSSAFSGANAVSATASKSVDFGTTDDSDLDESGLLFAYKFRVFERDDFANYKITSGTLTAGDSLGTNCTAGTSSNLGYWYCPVPLANTETTANFRHDDFATQTLTYTDRTSESDTQQTGDVKPVRKPLSGVCYSCAPTITPEVSPEAAPSPTSEVSPAPAPTPALTPTPTPAVVKLYRKANDPKVYVEDGTGLLNWVRTLKQFNNSGYKWEDVKVISGEEFAKLKMAPSSEPAKLFRKTNDPKVYIQGGDGTLSWVKTLEEFNAAGYNWTDVQIISGSEFAKMVIAGARVRVVKGISWLNVRNSASTSGQAVGRVLPGEEYEFSATSGGWYKIKKNGADFGWVFGKYANEF